MIDTETGYVYYTPVYYVLAQLSRMIRPDDKAVATRRRLGGLDRSRYRLGRIMKLLIADASVFEDVSQSLRDGRAQLRDSHVFIKNGEAWITGVHITPLPTVSTHFNIEDRNLLVLLLHIMMKTRSVTLCPCIKILGLF